MSIKAYIRDFNNILLPLKDKFELVDNPRHSDVIVIWNDVRDPMKALCEINKEYLHKPLVVIQHGRGACNDYLPPNKFPLIADKFCCWGQKEYERLERAGYKDKAVITGSPIVSFLKKREEHDGKNIVFVPVITSHEEPENIMTYWKLKQIELSKASQKIEKNFDKLKNSWNAWEVEPTSATEGSIPYHNFNKEWRLIAKIVPLHDKRLYLGDVVCTTPVNKMHLADCINILSVTDCVVGMEEGTFQLLAMAMGIPCVMVDGFRYTIFGNIDYSTVDMIKTNGVRRVKLSDLEQTIDEELANPDSLKEQREKIIKDELWDGETDPITNIINVIKGVI